MKTIKAFKWSNLLPKKKNTANKRVRNSAFLRHSVFNQTGKYLPYRCQLFHFRHTKKHCYMLNKALQCLNVCKTMYFVVSILWCRFSAIVFQYRITTCQKEAVFMEFKIEYGTYIRLFCSHFQAMQFHSLIKINVLSVTYKFRDETKEKPTLIATWKRNWCLKYCLHTAHVCVGEYLWMW